MVNQQAILCLHGHPSYQDVKLAPGWSKPTREVTAVVKVTGHVNM